MKNETAIVPTTGNDCGVNTRANGRADRKVLCRKHDQKPQTRATEV